MDQFYISYTYTAPSPLPTIPATRIIHPTHFPYLQSLAEKVLLNTLVKSYISSLLIALRLHPAVISTSISARVVGDVRNLVKVAHLRDASVVAGVGSGRMRIMYPRLWRCVRGSG